jgi:hypothetical protein
MPLPWITTVACLTEASYLVGKSGGYIAQDALARLTSSGLLDVADFP